MEMRRSVLFLTSLDWKTWLTCVVIVSLPILSPRHVGVCRQAHILLVTVSCMWNPHSVIKKGHFPLCVQLFPDASCPTGSRRMGTALLRQLDLKPRSVAELNTFSPFTQSPLSRFSFRGGMTVQRMGLEVLFQYCSRETVGNRGEHEFSLILDQTSTGRQFLLPPQHSRI